MDIAKAADKLESLITDTYNVISVYFPNADTNLSIDTDPENGEQSLLLTITAGLEPKEAFETLQEFDSNWWLDNMGRADGELHIFLELS